MLLRSIRSRLDRTGRRQRRSVHRAHRRGPVEPVAHRPDGRHSARHQRSAPDRRPGRRPHRQPQEPHVRPERRGVVGSEGHRRQRPPAAQGQVRAAALCRQSPAVLARRHQHRHVIRCRTFLCGRSRLLRADPRGTGASPSARSFDRAPATNGWSRSPGRSSMPKAGCAPCSPSARGSSVSRTP